ncbi:ParB N-terminal domain-containing protein, partial [Papillibacter cinnamivorans]
EWLMKGIAKYGDTVTDLLHGAAKNADDAAEWGLLVSAVRKAEESADILKSAARNADEALDAAQSAAKSADELIEGTGNVVTAKSFKLTPTHSKMLSNKEFSALMDNIKVNGIQESIKYIKYNGNMYVVDGHHRLLAAKKLGITEVPIEEVKLPYKSYGTFEDLFWGN